MFDDKPTDNNNKLPPNLPTSEPEDIFAGSDEDVKSEQEVLQEPEKMPEPEVEKETQETALNVGVLRAKAEGVSEEKPKETEINPVENELKPDESGLQPIDHTKKVEMQTPPTQSGDLKKELQKYEVKEPGMAKAIMIGSIVVVALIVLLGGAWWLYATFMAGTEEKSPFVDEVVEPEVVEEVVIEDVLPEDVLDDELLFGGAVDSDGDGLDDIRESDIGTDPNNWDTDGDALSDYDEVTIWKTNPLDADTDGDGYLDGAEVTAGFSPTGPGKLFDVTNLDSSNTSTK
ncbi:MAG: thrombospondin type 3 repeat-containing protein [Candidatus Magasanikbacteria bacterium]|nr:thrombospondin type 3 repeat-containing protein [Candidatus Magasanikbacteria bacterium]